MSDISQQILLDVPEKWESEWVDMPEFIQGKKRPYKEIIIRFASKEDYEAFQRKIGQSLTIKTKSIWYPFRSHWGDPINKKRYVDES